MTEWERVHGRVIEITEPDEQGNFKVITDKSKPSILLDSVIRWVKSIKINWWVVWWDFLELLYLIIGVLTTIGVCIIVGVIIASHFIQSLEYLFDYVGK